MIDGLPLLADDRTLDVRNVIWCTGYQHGFPWINLPIFEEDGEPVHEKGIVPNVPGMYFVGLHFLHAMSSATLIGVGGTQSESPRPSPREPPGHSSM